MYQPGDIVHVKNASNGIGVYQIIDFNPAAPNIEGEPPCNWGVYRVHVLDIDRNTLPKVGVTDWNVTPKRYLTMCKKNPELYKLARFRKYNLTTKQSWNIYSKLPFTSDQVIA